jgi:hypothetical protein
MLFSVLPKRLDISVVTVTGNSLVGQGSIAGRDKRFFSITFRPALGLTQPPIQWILVAVSPRAKLPGCEAEKLTTHIHLVPRSRMVELYLNSPICLHGIVLNYIIKYRVKTVQNLPYLHLE